VRSGRMRSCVRVRGEKGLEAELRRQQCVRESKRGESVRFLCLGLIVRFKYYRVSLLSKYRFGLRLG
jgi:hypothetical protein